MVARSGPRGLAMLAAAALATVPVGTLVLRVVADERFLRRKKAAPPHQD